MKKKDSDHHGFLEDAIPVAKGITEGTIDPNLGCDQIAAICAQHNYARELIEFEHLSHLQAGHEAFGFNKENLREGILVEARKLLELRATEPVGRINSESLRSSP